MIVKSIGFKGKTITSINRLVEYITNPKAMEDPRLNRKPVFIKQFLKSNDISTYAGQIKENDNRCHYSYGKKRLVMRHCILSFSPEEADEHLSSATLRNIIKAYIKIKAPKSLVVASVHFEQDHVHAHIASSAVDIEGNSTRVSREELIAQKQAIQEYQLKNFPELSRSIVNHPKKKVRTSPGLPKKNN